MSSDKPSVRECAGDEVLEDALREDLRDLVGAAERAAVELGALADQVNAKPGGSVRRALKELREALNEVRRPIA